MKQLLVLFLMTSLSATAQVSEGVTFAVDQVEQNQKPLNTTSIDTIFQNKFRREIIATPSSNSRNELIPTWQNGLVETIHIAFDEHRPLILSPDDIWLAICQGFGNHMAVTADEMKQTVVSDGAPEEIRVFIRDLAEGDSEGWENMVNGFNDSLQLYLKNDPVSLVNQQFSTTTPVITTAYQITLMDAVKTYFSYAAESGCGIPYITLLGTTEDWQKIYDQLDKFNAYGLEFWTRELKPVIQEFIDASKGEEHVEFWQSIYKHEIFYGASSVTGWIHKLFPYLKSTQNMEEEDVMEWRELEFKKTYIRNPFMEGKNHLLSDIGTNDFPKGYVIVPFIWDEYLPESGEIRQRKLKITAGFFGIEQSENLALHPHITWSVFADSDEEASYLKWGNNQKPFDSVALSERYYWKPGIIDSSRTHDLIELPIFDPENNSDYESGITSFSKLLKDNGFNSNGKSTLQVISTIDGSTLLESIEGPLSSRKSEIQTFLDELGQPWKPAQGRIYPFDVDIDHADANYRFELKL